MKRYFIEDAKCGIAEGGLTCGPVPGNVVVTVKYREGDEVKWINWVEVEGIPNVFLTDKDDYEDFIEDDADNEEFNEYMHRHSISEFNGIALSPDYSDVFDCISGDSENPAIPLIKYIIALVRCDMDDVEDIIKMARGKYADELDIPVSDLEEEYLEEYEEDLDEDEEDDE